VLLYVVLVYYCYQIADSLVVAIVRLAVVDNDTVSHYADHIVDLADSDVDAIDSGNVGDMNYVDSDVVDDNNCVVAYEVDMNNVVAFLYIDYLVDTDDAPGDHEVDAVHSTVDDYL